MKWVRRETHRAATRHAHWQRLASGADGLHGGFVAVVVVVVVAEVVVVAVVAAVVAVVVVEHLDEVERELDVRALVTEAAVAGAKAMRTFQGVRKNVRFQKIMRHSHH